MLKTLSVRIRCRPSLFLFLKFTISTDRATLRGADGIWQLHQWLKKAALLSFRLNPNMLMEGPGGANWRDKVPGKFSGWSADDFQKAGIRTVPAHRCSRPLIGRHVR